VLLCQVAKGGDKEAFYKTVRSEKLICAHRAPQHPCLCNLA